MARKVQFPQFLKRARLMFVFEMDMFVVVFFSALIALWIFSKFLKMIIAIPLSFYLAYKLMLLYNKARYEMSPGFILHFLYSKGLYKPKEDFEKYPELKTRGKFFPSGYVTDFRD